MQTVIAKGRSTRPDIKLASAVSTAAIQRRKRKFLAAGITYGLWGSSRRSTISVNVTEGFQPVAARSFEASPMSVRRLR